MDRRMFVASGIALSMAGLLPTIARAAKAKIFSNSATGVAINGYDPVAYFTESKPVEGSEMYAVSWKDAIWYFASAENKAIFEAMPEKYAPQYGGYCAYAVSYGSTATTVPEAWTIVDGKLYLNFSVGVQSRWNKDQKGYIAKANRNWPGVVN